MVIAVISRLKSSFSVAGAGAFSTKKADASKLAKYFLYLAKGVNGKRGDAVHVVAESAPRMWSELHTQYHDTADTLAASRVAVSPDFYVMLRDRCVALKADSKEDVLEQVTKWYVYESKKGFDRFAVTRTFWRVYALVNGADAHAFLLEQVRSDVLRV